MKKIFLIVTILACSKIFPQNTEIFSVPGTYTWVVPSCVTTITVQAWGGGGGGGAAWSRITNGCSTNCQESCNQGGGGGGGGFTSRVYAVTPGEVYNIVVGAGGLGGTSTGGNSGSANPGGAGGNSTFSGPATVGPGILTAFGGGGGGAANGTNSSSYDWGGHIGVNGTGGVGGSGLNGTTTYNGGNGSSGSHSGSCYDFSGAGGGGAGTNANGSNGSTNTCPSTSKPGGPGGASLGGNGADAGRLSGYNVSSQVINGAAGVIIGGGGAGTMMHYSAKAGAGTKNGNGGAGARGEVRIIYSNGSSPGITSTSATSLTCSSSNAIASITYTNGATTFNWSGPGITSGGTTGTITVNTVGAYVYTASVNGCETTGTINVTGNTTQPVISSTSTGTLTCSNTSLTIGVTSPTSPISYNWSGPGILSGGSTASPSVNQPGNYNYTVTNTSNGCSITGLITVNTNTTQPSATASTSGTLTCNNSNVILNGGPATGVSYSWSGSGLTGATNTMNASATLPGTYTLITTNAVNGCTNSAVVSVTSNTTIPNVTSSVSNSINCSNTTATVVASTLTSPVSFTWSGPGISSGTNSSSITVNAGGIYNYTVTNNSNGCKATGNVNVIQDAGAQLANASASSSLTCSNTTVSLQGGPASGVTYTWTGPGLSGNVNTQNVVANTSGDYTLTVSDPTGCSSSTVVTVYSNTVSPSISVGPTLTLTCSSPIATLTGNSGTPGVTFSWNGPNAGSNPTSNSNDVSADGDYTLTITNPVNGCTNTAVQSVVSNTASIPSTPSITATSTNLCAGQTATLTSSSLVNNVWSNGSTATSIVVNTSGTYSLYIGGGSGCNSGTTSISVNISTLSIDVTVPQNISACNGNIISVPGFSSSVAGTTFNWSNSNTAINLASSGLGSITSFIANNTNSSNIQSIISVTPTANGCTGNPESFTITVYPNVIVNAGSDYTVCYGQQYQINASPNNTMYTYSWSPNTFLSNSTIYNPIANPSSNTTYTLTVTDNNGCIGSDEVTLYSGTPIITALPGTTLCAGSSSVLTPSISGGNNQSYTYQWQPSNGLNNSTSLNPIVNPSTTTVYTLTVNDGCSSASTTQATVTVYSLPEINITSSYTSGCAPLCVDLTNLNNTNVINWQWSANGENISNSQNPQYCFKDPGSYNIGLSVTSSEGCSNSQTLNNYIVVYPNPTADFFAPETLSILTPDVTFTDNSIGASTWLWDFNDPFATANNQTSTLQNPSHFYSNQGNYCINLVVTNSFGCTDYTTKCLKIEPEFTIYVPNAFSPDDDNINDIFTAVGINIIEFEMRIFDRWGEEIFYTKDLNNGWNGKVKNGNQTAKQDVYVWKITARDIFNEDHFLTGHVTLIKKEN